MADRKPIKFIKDSEQIISGVSETKQNPTGIMHYVYHKDVTAKPIPCGGDCIGEFMNKMAEKRMFCKKQGCKLNLTTWAQVMA